MPSAFEAAPTATSLVCAVTLRSKSSQSRSPVSVSMRTTETSTPRSRSSACHGATLAWWSSSVTTTRSPAENVRPSVRERWKASVVMFAPKTISCGDAFRKSASDERAASIISSVSALVG